MSTGQQHPAGDVIADAAEQLGTGRWAAQEALEAGVPAMGMAAAIFARSASQKATARRALRRAGLLPGHAVAPPDQGTALDDIRSALTAGQIIAYAEGFDTIAAISETNAWNVDLDTVARIWQRGSIVRAQMLGCLRAAFRRSEHPGSLLADSDIAGILSEAVEGWRRAVVMAIGVQIPVPGMAAGLSYYDTLRAHRLPTALIQAQRDYIGSHTYRRVDKQGTFHTIWYAEPDELTSSCTPGTNGQTV